MTEGRTCPLAYRYQPDTLCDKPEELTADVIYVIGGLYGNPYALDEIERMALEEENLGHSVALVFNGDFNWFNANHELFRNINSRVLDHTVSLGNVDYELAHPSEGAGCGCAYPDFVDQGVVERSNDIMKRLQSVAADHPDIQSKLASLPRYRCLMFGGLKILVLHGDPESLAGWGLAYESFQNGNEPAVVDWLRRSGADVIASTHTCLPCIWSGKVDERKRITINNGAAGLGNLHGDRAGLITRIARYSSIVTPVAGLEHNGLHVSLVPVAFDCEAWLAEFDSLWPAGSPASVSYRERICTGTDLAACDLMFPRW